MNKRISISVYSEQYKILKAEARKYDLAMHELVMLSYAKSLTYDKLKKVLHEANREWLRRNMPEFFKQIEPLI